MDLALRLPQSEKIDRPHDRDDEPGVESMAKSHAWTFRLETELRERFRLTAALPRGMNRADLNASAHVHNRFLRHRCFCRIRRCFFGLPQRSRRNLTSVSPYAGSRGFEVDRHHFH